MDLNFRIPNCTFDVAVINVKLFFLILVIYNSYFSLNSIRVSQFTIYVK